MTLEAAISLMGDQEHDFKDPEAFFWIPKFDQVINCPKVHQIGSVGSYPHVNFMLKDL